MDDASDNNNRCEKSQGAGRGILPGTITHFTIESTNTGVEEMANRIEMRFEALMAQNIENQESTSRLTSQVAELVRMHEEQRQEQEKQQEATDKKIDGIVAFLDRLTQQAANMKQAGAGKGTSFCREELYFDKTVHVNPALRFRQQKKERLPDGRINFECQRRGDTDASRAGLTPTEKAIKDILPQMVLEHEVPSHLRYPSDDMDSTLPPTLKLHNADATALGSLLRMQIFLLEASYIAYKDWAFCFVPMLSGDFQQLRNWTESTYPS